jgi:predicted ATPase
VRLTPLVGRDGELDEVTAALAAGRLLTLTGPGGVGKTRLALAVAVRATAENADVAWADLAEVTDPRLIAATVAARLGVEGTQGADPVAAIAAHFAGRQERDARPVLVLDGCEQATAVVASLAERLLAGCQALSILATSREPLQIHGETLHVVAPLAAPAETESPELSTTYPAVRLFVDRAAAVLPGFDLDAANAEAVASICRNLDGMPLAIELATPWLRTLTPAQLAERLDDRFALLTGGSRTALPRHQTLRAVVAWSWDLLSERERVLARRLAVFPGGATLTAAEPRYRMLDTVRAYSLERLAEAGEEAATKDASARYYVELAETADPQLRTKTQAHWFRTLTAEQDNVNAAIRWAIVRQDAVTALRSVRALGYYWVQRGYGEADALSREVLAMTPPPLTKQIAEGRVICALLAAGWAWDIESIREPLEEALQGLYRFGTDYGTFHPLVALAEPLIMQYDGDTDVAQQHFERYETARDPWLRALGKTYIASYAISLGKLDGAEDKCRDGLAELRALWGVALALTMLSDFTELRGDHAASIAATAEAATIGRELGVWGDLTFIEGRLALFHARAGHLDRGYAEMGRVQRNMDARGGRVDTDRWVAFMLAELAARAGDHAEVVRCGDRVLAAIADNAARWWESLRAQTKARQAVALLRQGDQEGCLRLLREARDAAASWWEHPALASVLDACAVYVLGRDSRDGGERAAAEQAARLLGAAHAVRGAFDESGLDGPPARAQARETLGPDAFQAAYESALASTYDSALALAGDLLSAA